MNSLYIIIRELILKKTVPSLYTFCLFSFFVNVSLAQGTWTPVTNLAPDSCGGVMLLMSDGSVIAKAYTGGNDSIGSIWNKLTPDIHGSYVNGTWTSTASMNHSRLYFSSQVLKDGRVYVAGGEYGTGYNKAETYDPVVDQWTMAPSQGVTYSDANSEILPDGRVLQAIVGGGSHTTSIFNPLTNSWSPSPTAIGSHNESSWVKLPDQSILFVDVNSVNSERYIPSLNQWVVDAQLPNQLYDPFGSECGPGLLLPDGRAFFLGGTNQTAIYTPSGTTSPGTWAAGPVIPNNKGVPDGAAAMLPNGKILCAVSHAPTSITHIFDAPTWFYEFDYLTNYFNPVLAPNGLDTLSVPSYYTNMLVLPDGNILFADLEAVQYYIYSPSGSPLVAGKPAIDTLWNDTNCNYTITGTNFNGISEGASYGDDFQMATNYPLVRLTNGSNVYYARTFNWNRTDVQIGGLADTTQFSLPTGLPVANYWLQVIVNGIASDSISFTPCFNLGVSTTKISNDDQITLYPNPATDELYLNFNLQKKSVVTIELIDILGQTLIQKNKGMVTESFTEQMDISKLSNGVYFIKTTLENKTTFIKFVKE